VPQPQHRAEGTLLLALLNITTWQCYNIATFLLKL
jgi:hypothetical protein